jgi:hypothetical protein
MEVLPTGDGIPTVAWMETGSPSDVRARVEPEQKVPGGKATLMKGGLIFSAKSLVRWASSPPTKGEQRRTHHEQHNTSHPGPPGQSGPPPLEQQRDVVVPLHGAPSGLHETARARVAQNELPRSSPKAAGSGPAERNGRVNKKMLDWGGTFSFPPLQA